MYTDFFGLRELPFELTPNPKYLLLTARHREALANLQYGISSRKGLTLLVGEAGTGKTTLVHAALQSDACRAARILHLANPMLSRDEFVECLARGFDLSGDARASKSAMLNELQLALHRRRAEGVTTALVIDEAQVLPEDLLEEVRLLANIETASEKLLPVVLAGQPELAERLNQHSLRQLKQRVALRCTLGLLDQLETHAYVTGRLRIAGAGQAAIFTREALDLVHVRSGGVPRLISVICDNALVNAYAAGVKPVPADIVAEVCEDFDLRQAAPRAISPGFAAPRPAGVTRKAPPGAARAVLERPGGGLFSNVGRKRGLFF
jgi:type II secretory pathway predicted ATPase ExeA